MLWIFKAHQTELAALLAVMLLSVGALMVWLEPYSGKAQSSALSDSWMGHSHLLERLQQGRGPVRLLSNLSNLQGNGVLVITAPDSELPEAPLLSHLRQGGAMLLADNSIYSEKFLAAIGVSRRNGTVVDKAGYFLREDAPLARYKDGWVALKLPSALVVEGNHTALLSSSDGASWVDADGDGRITDKDPRGPFLMAAALAYNSTDENAIIISDSFMLSNDMIGEQGNARFLDDSIAMLDPEGSREVLLYDGGRSEQSGYLAFAIQGSKASSSPYTLAGFAAVFGLLLWLLGTGGAEYQEGFTLFDRLVFGVSKNIGRRKAPYVWLMEKLRSRLSDEIRSCASRPDTGREAYARARALEESLAGKDFSAMDALGLEAKIKEVSSAIAALGKRKNDGGDGKGK